MFKNSNTKRVIYQPVYVRPCCIHHKNNGGSCLDNDPEYRDWVIGVHKSDLDQYLDESDYWASERVFMGMGG